MKPRVLLVGSHWGVVDQTDDLLRKAFERLGYPTDVFDYQSSSLVPAIQGIKRWIPKGIRKRFSPRKHPKLAQLDLNDCNTDFLKKVSAFKPDVVIALRAERLTAETVNTVRASGVTMMNWTSDEPWQFNPPETIAAYDLWAVADTEWFEWMQEQGVQRIEHLPLACDPDLHQLPVNLSEQQYQKWRSPLVFVGSHTLHREKILSVLADQKIAIWGPGWDKVEDTGLKQCVRESRSLSREEWLQVYAAADVVVNVQAQGQAGLSLRVWESVACGVCLVTDARLDIERFLPQGVVSFQSPEELKLKCIELLENKTLRVEAVQGGREHVLAQHTFEHRAKQLMQWAESLNKNRTLK